MTPPLSPSILKKALNEVLHQKFDTQNEYMGNECKAALEEILQAPEMLVKLAEVIEKIDGISVNPSLALPLNLNLREFPTFKIVDAISEGWPIGSIPENPATVPEPPAASIAPILSSSLKASKPVWLKHLLDTNLGCLLAVDLRQPASLTAAGDGWNMPPIDIGECDSIQINITSTEITIDPIRMTNTEPLWLSVGEIRKEQLAVIGYWKFEQTLENYSWINTFKSGVLIVSTRPIY